MSLQFLSIYMLVRKVTFLSELQKHWGPFWPILKLTHSPKEENLSSEFNAVVWNNRSISKSRLAAIWYCLSQTRVTAKTGAQVQLPAFQDALPSYWNFLWMFTWHLIWNKFSLSFKGHRNTENARVESSLLYKQTNKQTSYFQKFREGRNVSRGAGTQNQV